MEKKRRRGKGKEGKRRKTEEDRGRRMRIIRGSKHLSEAENRREKRQ